MSFPEIRRAKRVFASIRGRFNIKSKSSYYEDDVIDERLSRAKLGKSLADSLAIASVRINSTIALDIISDIRKELLRQAELDE